MGCGRLPDAMRFVSANLGRVALLALAATATADDLYQPSKCEACEVAVEEGFNFVSKLVSTRRGVQQAINLAHEFPHVLREDRVNVWSAYSKVHRTNLKETYLAPTEPQKSHWKSVEVSFVNLYGAKDLDRKSLALGAKGSGQIKSEDAYGVWRHECVELSGWCKHSALRSPPRPLTPCGACREVVRDLLIDARRRADAPPKVRLGALEELFADVCTRVPARHEPGAARYVQKVCEEVLQDEHGEHVPLRLHKLLQGGPASWAELGSSGDATWDTLEEQVCSADLLGCDYSGAAWRDAQRDAAGARNELARASEAQRAARAADESKAAKRETRLNKEQYAALRARLTAPGSPQHVQCDTTQGQLLIKLLPSVSPYGVRRLLDLVEDGHFTNNALFRNVPGFLVQFGQRVGENRWDREDPIADDTPRRRPRLTRGTLSFAGSGENSRTSQLFVAYCRKCGEQLGKRSWETAVGRLVGADSMATLDKIEAAHDYGDFIGGGGGPRPGRIRADADGSYLRGFPKLDYIKRCDVVKEGTKKTPKQEL